MSKNDLFPMIYAQFFFFLLLEMKENKALPFHRAVFMSEILYWVTHFCCHANDDEIVVIKLNFNNIGNKIDSIFIKK